jgi:hypothetical protein
MKLVLGKASPCQALAKKQHGACGPLGPTVRPLSPPKKKHSRMQRHLTQRSNNHTGYQFKADNVILSYSSTSRVTTAAEQLASGLAAFVSVDGQIGEADRASFPSETTEVPVAGGALLVAYNLPGNPPLVPCALQPLFVSF